MEGGRGGGGVPAGSEQNKKKISFFFLDTQVGQPGLGPGLTGTSTRSEAEILAGWRPDPWIPGLASKPWKFMHFRASAIHDQKPLCFAYDIEGDFEKSTKSSLISLGIHDVFALESPVPNLL